MKQELRMVSAALTTSGTGRESSGIRTTCSGTETCMI